MNQESLCSKTVKELNEICKNNRELYSGYSKCKRKQILIDFIISKSNPVSEQYEESSDDMGEILQSMFTEPEESVNESFRDRPPRELIDNKIQEIETYFKNKNKNNTVVFDNHNDEGNGNMYRIYKHNYYNKYDDIGEEIILFHGTDEENITDILNDGFSLTVSMKHGNIFGNGIYFTNDIDKALSYSERYKNKKYVIMCVVHIGDVIKGEKNMGIHPKMPNKDKRYDTSVDNIKNPIQFIKKENYTYNILGILSFEIKRSFINRCNLVIINNSYEDIRVYWVPLNKSVYDPDIIKYSKFMGKIIKAKHEDQSNLTIIRANEGKYITNMGHKFICVNSTGCIRIIEIRKKKERIIIRSAFSHSYTSNILQWECKKCKWNNNDNETKCKICKLSRF